MFSATLLKLTRKGTKTEACPPYRSSLCELSAFKHPLTFLTSINKIYPQLSRKMCFEKRGNARAAKQTGHHWCRSPEPSLQLLKCPLEVRANHRFSTFAQLRGNPLLGQPAIKDRWGRCEAWSSSVAQCRSCLPLRFESCDLVSLVARPAAVEVRTRRSRLKVCGFSQLSCLPFFGKRTGCLEEQGDN